MASRTPPERTSGRHHALSFASGATARAVATSAHPLPSSSARARTTDTLARARSPATSSSHTTRRSSGSTSVTETSSRAIASTNPGRPAPDPTSTTLAAGGSSGATAAQLRTCRVQSRGTSRGPRSPRSTAEVRRCSAKASARSLRGPNQASMAAGGGGAPSAPGGPVPSAADAVVTASVNRLDDHTTSRLDAFGLASEPGLRDHVVHDLPLEGVHRLEPHGLTGPLDLGDGPGCDVLQRPSAAGTIAGDVEHEAATLAGPRLYGEAGQLLQRLQDLSVGADQLAQLTVRTPLAEDRDRGAAVLHVDVDVSVEVSDVEQLLEVVGRHLALLLEALQRRPAPRPLRLARSGLLLGLVSRSRSRDASTLLLVVPVGRCIRLGHDAPLANGVTPPPSVGVTEGSTPTASTAVTGARAALTRPLGGRWSGGPAASTLGLVLALRLLALARARRLGNARLRDGRRLLGLGRLAAPCGLLAPTLEQRLLRDRPRGGHPPDHVELLAHGPEVGRQPVDQHADREVDARHREDQRKEVHEHLLLTREGVVQRRGRHVLGHQLPLRRERGQRHQDDEDDGDDPGRDVGGVHERRGQRRPEDRGMIGRSHQLRVERPDGLALRDAVEDAEQREEDRRLQQDRKA